MMKRLAFLSVMLLLAAASAVGPRGPVRGAAAVLLLFLVIGSMIRWLTDRSTRLSSSGRDPQDLGTAWSARPGRDYDRPPHDPVLSSRPAIQRTLKLAKHHCVVFLCICVCCHVLIAQSGYAR